MLCVRDALWPPLLGCRIEHTQIHVTVVCGRCSKVVTGFLQMPLIPWEAVRSLFKSFHALSLLCDEDCRKMPFVYFTAPLMQVSAPAM